MLIRFLRFFYTALVVVPTTLFFGTTAILFWPLDNLWQSLSAKAGERGPGQAWSKRNWSRFILGLHGIRLSVEGHPVSEIKKKTGVVFVANHQSLLDIPALFLVLPSNAGFIAKKELSKIPIFGAAGKSCGTLYIDRKRGTENESLREVQEFLAKGFNLIVFPEGTRSPTGELLSFKRGAFVFAIQAQRPIIPISILNSRELLPKKKLGIRGCQRIRLHIGDEISTLGLKFEDRLALSERVRSEIANQLEISSKTRKN